MQSGKKRRKIAKINPKSKEKFALSARISFWSPSFLKFFPGMVGIYQLDIEIVNMSDIDLFWIYPDRNRVRSN